MGAIGQQVVLVLLGAAIALLGSLITSIVQHRLALQREYSQRWWERKADAYSQIIEQLSNLWDTCDWYLKLEEDREEAWEEYRQAMEYVRKATVAQAYVLSDDTVTALKELLRAMDIASDYPTLKNALILGSIERCIGKVKEYAEVDLHIR